MARIKTVSPEAVRGIRKLAVWQAKRLTDLRRCR